MEYWEGPGLQHVCESIKLLINVSRNWFNLSLI
jgi:hypothetical protein